MAAPPDRVWEALLAHDLAGSPLARLILFLRGYGSRALGSGGGNIVERLKRFGFTKLREVTGHELVFGLAGKFWTPSGGLRPIADARAFDAFAEDGYVKAAWNLRIGEVDRDRCDLSTETRIVYFGKAARWRFRVYWSIIRLFSGALRRGLLRGIRREAERRASS